VYELEAYEGVIGTYPVNIGAHERNGGHLVMIRICDERFAVNQ